MAAIPCYMWYNLIGSMHDVKSIDAMRHNNQCLDIFKFALFRFSWCHVIKLHWDKKNRFVTLFLSLYMLMHLLNVLLVHVKHKIKLFSCWHEIHGPITLDLVVLGLGLDMGWSYSCFWGWALIWGGATVVLGLGLDMRWEKLSDIVSRFWGKSFEESFGGLFQISSNSFRKARVWMRLNELNSFHVVTLSS